MPDLTAPDLPDDVFERLMVRAGKHGRSIEAEAEAILVAACAEDEKPRTTPEEARAAAERLQAFVDKLYGGRKPKNVVDDLIAERRREAAREASDQAPVTRRHGPNTPTAPSSGTATSAAARRRARSRTRS